MRMISSMDDSWVKYEKRYVFSNENTYLFYHISNTIYSLYFAAISETYPEASIFSTEALILSSKNLQQKTKPHLHSSLVKLREPSGLTSRDLYSQGMRMEHLPYSPLGSTLQTGLDALKMLEEIKNGHKRQISLSSTDSKRTLIPTLNVEYMPFSRRAGSKFNKESKGFGFISNIELDVPKKKTNPRCFESQVFNYKKNPKKPDFLMKKKRTPYQKYSTTSQIVNLPGCVKRKTTEISDDSREIQRNRIAFD